MAPKLFGISLLFYALVSFVPAMAQTEGLVKRPDVTLRYRVLGSGDPVLFLSGGPGLDVDYLLPVAEEIAKSHRCIMLDQRGTGKSVGKLDSAGAFTLATLVEDLEAVRADLKLSRWTVLGHSWGGMLGMAYAAAHPDRVEKLALVDSGGMDLSFYRYFFDNIFSRLRDEDVKEFAHWTDPAVVKQDPGLASFKQLQALVPGYFFDRKNAELLRAKAKRGSLHPEVSAHIVVGLQLSRYDLKARLRDFRRPVLIIQGRQDPIGDGTAYETHGVLRGSQLVFIDKSGHFPWIEQPMPFFEAIRAFLDGQPTAP